jgi:hypothetical protein
VSTVNCDATADLEALAELSGRPVHVIVPPGQLPLVHPVVQICPTYDVTKGWDVFHAADFLRGIMHDLPQYKRVGLLTHKKFQDKIQAALGEHYASRITMQAYFGDGLSRGSNQWLDRCDALIILGTPRPGSPSIRQHLMRIGKVRAAFLKEDQADWHLAEWTGTTESGDTRLVKTGRYRNEDWHRAYSYICKSQLKHAIGRGRGILPQGIPVYLVSTEDMSDRMRPPTGRPIPIADVLFKPLDRAGLDVLRVLEGTSAKNAMKTGQVCEALFRCTDPSSRNRTNYRLRWLERAGRVRRRKRRRGWYVTPAGTGSPNCIPAE